MSRKSKYGNMPPAPAYIAKVKGDAGSYRVWGIDWLNHRVLIDRAELAWVPIKNVALAAELLRIWKTWLGSSRDACDDAGKQLWDRIEAVLQTAD